MRTWCAHTHGSDVAFKAAKRLSVMYIFNYF